MGIYEKHYDAISKIKMVNEQITEIKRKEKERGIIPIEGKYLAPGIVNWDFVKRYRLGEFLYAPSITSAESSKRLFAFTCECLSESAPLTQGYYFDKDENVSQFIKGVLFVYYMGDIKRFYDSWKVMDSIKMFDLYMANKIASDSYDEHEILFIVNSYNRDYPNKKHKLLYRFTNTVIGSREWVKKKTFILSLTYDVGQDKDAEHGFGIPMFPIKDKIKEVLEAKANGKNLWQ